MISNLAKLSNVVKFFTIIYLTFYQLLFFKFNQLSYSLIPLKTNVGINTTFCSEFAFNGTSKQYILNGESQKSKAHASIARDHTQKYLTSKYNLSVQRIFLITSKFQNKLQPTENLLRKTNLRSPPFMLS